MFYNKRSIISAAASQFLGCKFILRSLKEKGVLNMEQKIGEIKGLLEQTSVQDLPQVLINYRKDSRSGVMKLVERFDKKYEKYQQELVRLEEMLAFEKKYASYQAICGIDEAGRGPLAGPVVAGAVILPKDLKILYLNDSKQLSKQQREALYDEIMDKAVSVGVGIVSSERIDEINILQATFEAMRQAIESLSVSPDLLLNDAVTIPKVSVRQVPIIRGDAKSLSIAAASVIAKVTRDRIMVEYDARYPNYGFAEHKGYGSKMHQEAIRTYGVTPIHRKTFLKNTT